MITIVGCNMALDRTWRSVAVGPRVGERPHAAAAAVLLAGCLACTTCIAGPTSWFFGGKPQSPHPSVARIVVDESDGVSLGSGTLVDVRNAHGLVVTNWHVIRDAKGPIRVVFPDGFRSAARILKVDRDWDLAALMIWRPNAIPVRLATVAPRPGEPLTIAGYGSGNYRAVSGSCTQYLAPSHQHPYEMVEVSASARQGDSGGPIFNTRGELAGVLFGSGGGTTSGSYAGRVGQFLATAWPPPEAAAAAVAAANNSTRPHTNTDTATAAASDLRQLPPKTPLLPLPDKEIPAQVAATPADQPSAEAIVPRPAPTATDSFAWESIAGPTKWDQFKTVLAAIGALAIFLKLTRRTHTAHTE